MTHSGRIFLSLWILFAFFADPLLEISSTRYFYLSRAIVEDGSFVIDRFAHAFGGDLAFYNGHYFSGTLPGIGFMLIPHAWIASYSDWPNQILQILSLWFFNAPIAALSALLLIKTLLDNGLDRTRAHLFGITAVLGTHFFFYTSKLSDYPVIMLLQLIMIRTAPRWYRVGIALGLCALINNLSVLLATLLILVTAPFFPLRNFCRRWALLIFGALPALLLRSWYLRSCFDSASADPLAYSAAQISIVNVYSELGSSWSVLLAMIKEIPSVLYGITFGETGLFLFSPIFLLFFFVRSRGVGQHLPALAKAGLFLAAVNALAHCALVGGIWKGGASWGPRYMLYSLAPMTIAIAFIARSIRLRLLLPLAALSIGINFIGVAYGYGTSIVNHIGLFFLGGPTTPLFRWLWLCWPWPPNPQRIALVMEETPLIGHYYAFTHPSPFLGFVLLGLVLTLIWMPVDKLRKIPGFLG